MAEQKNLQVWKRETKPPIDRIRYTYTVDDKSGNIGRLLLKILWWEANKWAIITVLNCTGQHRKRKWLFVYVVTKRHTVDRGSLYRSRGHSMTCWPLVKTFVHITVCCGEFCGGAFMSGKSIIYMRNWSVFV